MGLLNLQDKGARFNALRGLLSGYLTDAMEAVAGAPDRVGLLAEALANPREIGRQLANFPPLKRPEGNQMDSELGNLAMNFGTSPIAAAGTFIGKGAKTWNALRAAEAEAMEKAGHDPTAIWKQTGTWRGPDKHLRQEIDDSAAELQRPWKTAADGSEYQPSFLSNHPSVGGLLRHPDLDAAYGVSEIPLDVRLTPGAHGSVNNGRVALSSGLGYDDNTKSVLLHELQHAIQEREGWARGGMPGNMANILDDEAFSKIEREHDSLLNRFNDLRETWQGRQDIPQEVADEISAIKPRIAQLQNKGRDFAGRMKAGGIDYTQDELHNAYRRLAGEAEARATQARMNFSPEHRRAIPPFVSYDVPLEELIVRDRPQGLLNVQKMESNSYRGTHRPPSPQNGAPLHDLTGGGQVYPDDVYSPAASQYYGHGEDRLEDERLFRQIKDLRGKPDQQVTIYRAVPRDAPDEISHGDWVTISKKYAVSHGDRLENPKIISRKVSARQLFTNGDSPYEYGFYDDVPPE